MPAADLFAALRWWLVLLALGAAATPLAYVALGRLANRGYPFARMIGVLVVSTIFWLGGSLGFLGNDAGGILVACLGLLALSAAALRGRTGTFRHWLSDSRSQILVTEAVFLAAFALWTWVRAQNPAITATEKPMEFAFLNAANESPGFPPLDPWMSGFAISYYYFGYVMTSVIARLADVGVPVAFNLGIAWLFAGTAIGAFGLVTNLLRAGFGRRLAVTLGLVAAIALPLAGNMEILLETLHGRGVGAPSFWAWLDVRDLNGPATDTPRYEGSGWWWWRSSRVINEYHLSGRIEQGLEPIAEFPAFSFVLGDMHPHVLALPFAFLSLGIALCWWSSRYREREGGEPGRLGRFVAGTTGVELPTFLLTVVTLGGLSFLNTWDVLIHLFVVVGAFALARRREAGRWDAGIAAQAARVALLLAVPAVLLYLPFYLGFRSQAGAPFLLPFLMRPTRLSHFLIIFAMPLLPISFLLVRETLWRRAGRRWRAGLAVAAGLLLALTLLLLLFAWFVGLSPDGAARLVALAGELGVPLPVPPEPGVGWSLGAVLRLAPALLAARVQAPWLALLLAGLIGLAVMQLEPSEEPDRPSEAGRDMLPFVLLLIIAGCLLTLGPEFLYLRDNFGQRLNTIFKFYYQAWVLFGCAALFALALLWRQARTTGAVATVGYGLMLAIALTFPWHAVQSRQVEYGGPPTLDGLAYVARGNPDEYEALMWLRENAAPSAVVLEAVGGSYTGFARVSASTGRATVLGWPGHEQQWRGFANPEPGAREPAVSRIYSTTEWNAAAALLEQYGVEFVYVGSLERATYGQQGLEKFVRHMPIVFQNGTVTIHRWSPPASARRGRGPA